MTRSQSRTLTIHPANAIRRSLVRPLFLLLLLLPLLASACGSDPATAPTTTSAATFPGTVTDPVRQVGGLNPSAGSTTGISASSTAIETVAYVSVAPGTLLGGMEVTILNLRTSESVTAALVEGGFDPVGIAAAAGDTLTMTVARPDGRLSMTRSIVPATSPPRVVRTSPPSGRTDIAINATMQVVFSEPIDAATLDTTTVGLWHGSVLIEGAVRRLAGGTTVEFVPAAPLELGTTYTLRVGGGIADLTGDLLQQSAEFGFRTLLGPSLPAVALEFTVQPVNTELFKGQDLEVTVRDSLGGIAHGFTGAISISLASNPGGTARVLLGTIIVTPVNGIAAFPDMMLPGTGNGYRIIARATGLPPDTSAAFDVADYSGQWIEKAPPPASVLDAASAVLNGKLYVVGGYEGPNDPDRPVTRVMAYDPRTNSWSVKAPLPSAGGWDAVGVVNGLLYAIGGFGGPGSTAAIAAYNPATDTWESRAPMPTARRDGASIGVVGGTMYVIGGEAGSTAVKTVEAYDAATGTWATKAPMLTARMLSRTVAVNGRLYVIGGYANNAPVEAVEAYDPASNTWSSLDRIWIPRTVPGLASVGNLIYAVGGNSLGSTMGGVAPLEIYDVAASRWHMGRPLVEASTVAGSIDGVLYTVTASRTFAYQP